MDETIKRNVMNIDINLLQKKFGKNLITNENLSKYSWFNLGGPADIFFRPENKLQISEFLRQLKGLKYDLYILGAGSNTLIRDSGVKGIVIKLSSKFSQIKLLDKDKIEAGAATFDRKVADFAKEHSLSGMEFLSCIPGSIGGAVAMNCGCYGSDISQILHSVKVLDTNGEEKIITKNEIQFHYRGNNLPKNYIILSVILKGLLSSKEAIEKKQTELIRKKNESQPSKIKTGGSTFKNSNGKKAWALIKESGCDSFSVGDAKISEKHCNFFINNGKAKASDIEKLINKVKEEVKLKTGINLELEIKIIGNEK